MRPGEFVTLYALTDYQGNLNTVELYTTMEKAQAAINALSEADSHVYRLYPVACLFVRAENGLLYHAGVGVSENRIR